jgi:hypothetical protein
LAEHQSLLLLAHGVYFGMESCYAFSWLLLVLFWVVFESIKVYKVGIVSRLFLQTFSSEVSGLATLVAISGWRWCLDSIEAFVIGGINPCLVSICIVLTPVISLSAASIAGAPSSPVVLSSMIAGPGLVNVHRYGCVVHPWRG